MARHIVCVYNHALKMLPNQLAAEVAYAAQSLRLGGRVRVKVRQSTPASMDSLVSNMIMCEKKYYSHEIEVKGKFKLAVVAFVEDK